jgi:ankyrin repeat protein
MYLGLWLLALLLCSCKGEPVGWRMMPIGALAHAVLANDATAVSAELRRGANPNRTVWFKSLLQIAIEKNYLEVARALAQAKEMDVNKTDKEGVRPLYRAVFACNAEIADTLLQYGANPNERVKTTAGGLLRYGSFLTPLEGSVMCQDWKLFYFLLEHGADAFDTDAFSVSIQSCGLPGYRPEFALALMILVPDPNTLIGGLHWPLQLGGCRERLAKAVDTTWLPPLPTERLSGPFAPTPAIGEKLHDGVKRGLAFFR